MQDPVQSPITNETYSRTYITDEIEAGTLAWLRETGLTTAGLIPNNAMREATLYHRQNHRLFTVPIRVIEASN